MRAQLIRLELADVWYFNEYYYKCIDCGAEYMRHQYNERINPYCGTCQRKHDTEAQRQRNINHKNKLIIEELEKIKAEIEKEREEMLNAADWGRYYGLNRSLKIIYKHISELKGRDNNELSTR